MRLPAPRGPISELLLDRLRTGTLRDNDPDSVRSTVDAVTDPLADEDLQLALACSYELSYRGFDDVADELEWDPVVLAMRGQLERAFEGALVAAVSVPACEPTPAGVTERLRETIAADDGPSLSGYVLRHGTLEEFRELVVQRSAYHLKEADPHTWQIPRLTGAAKAALVEIQHDEYGGGRAGRMHSALYARVMRALDLDDTYGAYWDVISGPSFASINLMSLLGLHRRHRGASAGHLAAVEMTSTAPNRRYANALRRLGQGADATWFYDEHVEADAVHEQIAAVDLCGGVVAAEPALARDVIWGAACYLEVEARAGHALLSRWHADQRTSASA